MPRPPTSASPLLTRALALADGDAVAVADERGEATFGEVVAAAQRVSDQLLARGAGGRRVALALPRSRDWVVGFWGTLLAGATVVPLSEAQPALERRRLLAQSGALAVLTSRGDETETGAAARWELEGADVRGDVGAPFGSSPSPGVGSGSSSGSSPGSARAPALLLFTSGTTGTPKGVPLSHRAVLAGIDCLIEAWGMSSADCLVHALPLHHLHGICVALGTTFLCGGTTRLLPRFDVEAVLRACAGASVLMGVPTQHQRLVDHLDGCSRRERESHLRALRGLRLVTSGSAKLPEKLGRRMQEATGQYPLERYGMTEVGIVLGNPLAGPRRPGSCGRALPGCQVRIVDEQGKDVAAGESGEIWIRAPSAFDGYDGDPEATARALSAGFFASGDTATRDEAGFVTILGRTSVDIIKSGGEKLSAIEIEEQLREHPGVHDVAVVGVPDEQWGERAVAVVVATQALGPRAAADPESADRELRDFLRQRVSRYKVPRQFVFRKDLPRNALGKVQKPLLKDMLAATES